MGGSGKTTLARILYDEHSSSRYHFDSCAWVTVSQTYNPKQILQTLVDSIGEHQQMNTDLTVTLHKTLFGRRYLIVLDDIWSCQAWDDFQNAFPQNNNRSRIILTTRENIVANHVNLNSHQMHFLSEDDSWKLLREKVFGELSCPRELEDVGKRIAAQCGGLPLALQVIGGLLSQSEKSEHFWEHVAYNVSSLIAKTYDNFSGIFHWSFVNLPHYLKPCFLYMGGFPDDYEIEATTTIRMWVSEGFLYPIPDKSLEEVAQIHLDALVDRNLIFVRERKANGKAKSYGIHDLLRDLCLRKAQEKKFIYFKYSESDILQEDTLSLRRVIVQLSNDENNEFDSLKLTSLARSFLLTGDQESNRFVSCMCFKSSLLRVLSAGPSTISQFHKVFLKLVNLRYLSLWLKEGVVPRSISVLRNLQTLIVNSLESIMIIEDLPQLRNLSFVILEQRSYEKSFSVHENLRHLSYIPLETLSRLLGKLPNLRKLGIDGAHSNDNIDFTCFKKLESLCYQNGYEPDDYYFPNKTMFSNSIINLSLTLCDITQTILDALGFLPSLQILKFDSVDVDNDTWEPSDGGFRQLQYLKIQNSSLKNWLATDYHFPALRHLIFNNCRYITEIPNDIGGIETLEIIEVDECKTRVFESARRILEEQSQFGNTLLQLRLGCALEQEEKEGEEDEIKAMVKNNELELWDYNFRSTTILPKSLKSLKLYRCVLGHTSLHAIGILPKLVFLKLYSCKFERFTWDPAEGGFCKLQCLKITCGGLKNWSAKEIHFPVLRRLVLKECHGLNAIPNRLGGIETLESVELNRCYPDLFDSSRRILKKQHQRGNTLLRLRLGVALEYEVEEDEESE